MTLTETGTSQPWRRNRKTAILLAIFLGAWTWIYTYRRDAWKATLGLSLQMGAIIGGLLIWFWLRYVSNFLLQPLGNIPNELFKSVYGIYMTLVLIPMAILFVGIQIWAIVDASTAKVWELSAPKGRNKTAAILFAIFLSYATWLYTYPKDYKKFWIAFALAWVFPMVSYFTWFNPFQAIGTWAWATPVQYQLLSFAISLPGFVLWIIGIVLAAVRNGEWYKQAGQSTKPEAV